MQAGLESANFWHGLGAVFTDYNGDGRPDLYVANDEDPNQLYENVPWPGGVNADPAGLGFRFEERAAAEGVADRYAGMGIASADYNGDGRNDLFVTNSRREPSAAYVRRGEAGGAGVREHAVCVPPRARHELRGLGRLLGRPREHRQARPRARRGRDPGHEPVGGRRAGARARAPAGKREGERFGSAVASSRAACR